MSIPRIPLHDGTSIPQLGFGVFQVPPEQTEETVQLVLGPKSTIGLLILLTFSSLNCFLNPLARIPLYFSCIEKYWINSPLVKLFEGVQQCLCFPGLLITRQTNLFIYNID